MKQHSYMVAVQVTIRPTVYIEVVAPNAEAALKSVKNGILKTVANNLESFVDESRTDLEYIDATDVKVISCGRASQYHSDTECEVCKGVSNETR